MKGSLFQNINILASSLFVAVWKKLGIDTYYVSPGYRDAPFIAALQARNDVTVYSCFDERAAAYQALGYAKASKRPAVLVCTSGTAGANYYPAVIEASVDHIPLLIVTADRPFELVHAAAQQVIDQRNLYGRFSKRNFDFPAPSGDLDCGAWVSYAREALRISIQAPAGPIHINLPFRSPLDPVEDGAYDIQPKAEELLRVLAAMGDLFYEADEPALSRMWAEKLRASIAAATRGLLILGRITDSREQEFARRLAIALKWPVYADIGSGTQGALSYEVLDMHHPRARLALDNYQPDCVLHLGRRLVSRQFDDALQRWQPKVYWVVSSEQGVQDPSHLTQRVQVQASLESVYQVLEGICPLQTIQSQELIKTHDEVRALCAAVEYPDFCFSQVARTIALQTSGKKHGLFLGNSTAIRAFDSWLYQRIDLVRVEANRGVSGIEGLLATTIGLARATQHMWTAVLGDVSLMYDLNSVLSLAQQEDPIILVVVNNHGGRIFEGLPVSLYPWVKDPLISTPHDFSFKGLAAMAGLPYESCNNLQTFTKAYSAALESTKPIIIECIQGPQTDAQFAKFIKNV